MIVYALLTWGEDDPWRFEGAAGFRGVYATLERAQQATDLLLEQRRRELNASIATEYDWVYVEPDAWSKCVELLGACDVAPWPIWHGIRRCEVLGA